jgi:hypothetical protein
MASRVYEEAAKLSLTQAQAQLVASNVTKMEPQVLIAAAESLYLGDPARSSELARKIVAGQFSDADAKLIVDNYMLTHNGQKPPVSLTPEAIANYASMITNRAGMLAVAQKNAQTNQDRAGTYAQLADISQQRVDKLGVAAKTTADPAAKARLAALAEAIAGFKANGFDISGKLPPGWQAGVLSSFKQHGLEPTPGDYKYMQDMEAEAGKLPKAGGGTGPFAPTPGAWTPAPQGPQGW